MRERRCGTCPSRSPSDPVSSGLPLAQRCGCGGCTRTLRYTNRAQRCQKSAMVPNPLSPMARAPCVDGAIQTDQGGPGWNPELRGAPVDGEWESLSIMRGWLESSGRFISWHGRARGKEEIHRRVQGFPGGAKNRLLEFSTGLSRKLYLT